MRENLLHALARLKYVLNTPIWIDAMCINQSDESEKIGQIQIMTDIYKSAERVLVSQRSGTIKTLKMMLIDTMMDARSGSGTKYPKPEVHSNNFAM